MSEFKKEILKLHETTCLNSSGFYMQSVSSSFSEKMLFANAYGVSKEAACERGKLIACAPEMLEILDKIITGYENAGGEMWIPDMIQEHIFTAKKIIKKATE